MQAAASDDVLIRREGRAGRITMNRPAALNALTLGMVRKIWAALTAWVGDPAVHLVLLDGAGGRRCARAATCDRSTTAGRKVRRSPVRSGARSTRSTR